MQLATFDRGTILTGLRHRQLVLLIGDPVWMPYPRRRAATVAHDSGADTICASYPDGPRWQAEHYAVRFEVRSRPVRSTGSG